MKQLREEAGSRPRPSGKAGLPDFPRVFGPLLEKGTAGGWLGVFPLFEGHFPTCYVDLANFTQIIGSALSYTTDFLCNPPPDADSLPQGGREPCKKGALPFVGGGEAVHTKYSLLYAQTAAFALR